MIDRSQKFSLVSRNNRNFEPAKKTLRPSNVLPVCVLFGAEIISGQVKEYE
jgi:hypothetical protein